MKNMRFMIIATLLSFFSIGLVASAEELRHKFSLDLNFYERIIHNIDQSIVLHKPIHFPVINFVITGSLKSILAAHDGTVATIRMVKENPKTATCIAGSVVALKVIYDVTSKK